MGKYTTLPLPSLLAMANAHFSVTCPAMWLGVGSSPLGLVVCVIHIRAGMKAIGLTRGGGSSQREALSRYTNVRKQVPSQILYGVGNHSIPNSIYWCLAWGLQGDTSHCIF